MGTLEPSRQAALAEQLALPLVLELLPALPTTGVKTGATWRDSTTSQQRVAGATLPVTAVTSYDAHDAAGKRELEVVGSSRVRGKGTSTTFGQPIDITADGTRQRTWRLTPAGQLTGAEGSDSIGMTLDVPSVGQTVPATQIGRFTATRISPSR